MLMHAIDERIGSPMVDEARLWHDKTIKWPTGWTKNSE